MAPVSAVAVAEHDWDSTFDLVIVGQGCAGTCAAIEAADRGASVMLMDRLAGGGASAISGGVVYTGGGTEHQQRAGFSDSPDNMFNYMKEQVSGVVSEQTLRRFCDTSADNLRWLEAQGMSFAGNFFPHKTSFPGYGWELYFSGNENYSPYSDNATPAARGHIVAGKGHNRGNLLMRALRAVLRGRLRTQIHRVLFSEVYQLLVDDTGAVVGLRYRQLPQGGPIHYYLLCVQKLANSFSIVGPQIGARIRRLGNWCHRFAVEKNVRARNGVLLAGGGFIFNRAMVAAHVDKLYSPRPLGEDCQGSGIELGQSVGGATAQMDRITYWRFYAPPAAFLQAVLVGTDARRLCNEALYGATIADIMIDKSDGQGWLIIDSRIIEQAKRDLKTKLPWFHKMFGKLYLSSACTEADSLPALAEAVGIPPQTLTATMAAYNEAVSDAAKTPSPSLVPIATASTNPRTTPSMYRWTTPPCRARR